MTLDAFASEHAAEYQRLVSAGWTTADVEGLLSDWPDIHVEMCWIPAVVVQRLTAAGVARRTRGRGYGSPTGWLAFPL